MARAQLPGHYKWLPISRNNYNRHLYDLKKQSRYNNITKWSCQNPTSLTVDPPMLYRK